MCNNNSHSYAFRSYISSYMAMTINNQVTMLVQLANQSFIKACNSVNMNVILTDNKTSIDIENMYTKVDIYFDQSCISNNLQLNCNHVI